MKINQEQKLIIIKLFQEMNSKDDFLNILNIAKQIIYGDKYYPFEIRQLNFYINKDRTFNNLESIDESSIPSDEDPFKIHFINYKLKQQNKYYTQFKIKKKSGKDRTIQAPIKGLKEFQNALNIIFQCLYNPHFTVTGFVKGKSIVDNASQHVNQNFVYNIDLKDFFPSIDKSRIWGRLLIEPFNLNSSPERKKIANMIAALCCHSTEVERFEDNQWIKKNLSVLPQGAPTSPILTNIICEKLDIRLNGVAKRFQLKYSRYADDITFSSNHNTFEIEKNKFENIYSKNSTFIKEVKRIIEDQKFFINEQKVRLQKKGFRQEVTGVIVNEKLNIDKRYIKQLRQWLHFWEIHGYNKATRYFINKYISEKGHVKKGEPNMMMVLEGKLLYIKMIKGENDSTYLKLKERFDTLMEVKKNTEFNVVDLIFDVGLEKAMEQYKK